MATRSSADMSVEDSNAWFSELFESTPLMAILRGFGAERSIELATTAWDLGIDCVEVPIQSAKDVEALRAVVAAGRERGKPVGAGTVLSLENITDAQECGAAFSVSPGLDPDIVDASLAAGIPTLPGVATATEIQAALKYGLTWVKAFPASKLGPSWFSAMKGPFPRLNFVATGGLDSSNAAEYLHAGVQVAAIGSALSDSKQLPQLSLLLSN